MEQANVCSSSQFRAVNFFLKPTKKKIFKTAYKQLIRKPSHTCLNLK